MATPVLMPKLGLTMTEGTIVSWLKAEGDPVNPQEPLFIVETDKVTLEVESPAGGILLKILHQTGETLPLETLLAYIGEAGEKLPSPESQITPTLAANSAPRDSHPSPAEGDSSFKLPQSTSPIKASPIAKKLATQHNIDLSQIKGSGPDGRIIEADVRKAIEEKLGTPALEHSTPSIAEYEDIPINNLRKITAQRMEKSFSSIPHFYLKTQANLQRLLELRARLKPVYESDGLHLTYTDLFLFAVAQTLPHHPLLNAHKIKPDHTRIFKTVNLGVAVAVEGGLVVPVIHQAEKLSLIELCRQRNDLTQKAKTKQLTPQALSDATFTLTNLGMFGVEEFYPIINPPQSAILAVGAISEKLIAMQGAPAGWQPTVALVLAVDHRVADGVEAANFLQDLRINLEQANWNL